MHTRLKKKKKTTQSVRTVIFTNELCMARSLTGQLGCIIFDFLVKERWWLSEQLY